MADDLRQCVSGTIRAGRWGRAPFSEMTPDPFAQPTQNS
jgi:hypothetical protein